MAKAHARATSRGSRAFKALLWGLLVPVGLVFVALTLFAGVARVEADVLAPDLQEGDTVLYNRQAPGLLSLGRGDIVVVDGPEGTLVSRVVAMGGQTVEGRDGLLVVDGKEQFEEWLDVQGSPPFPLTEVPEDHVWVLNDDRSALSDSRTIGPVPLDAVAGRAEMRIWPFDRITFL